MLSATEGVRMKRLVAASLFALALFAAGAASAQTEKWNQEKVTALSTELVSSVSGLQNALQNSNQAQNPVMEDTVAQITDTLGLFEFEATHLNALLKSGKGLKSTLPAYKRLQELHSELTGFSGQIEMTAMLTPPITKAKTTLTKLAAYYPPTP
jgi:hypothetical protein